MNREPNSVYRNRRKAARTRVGPPPQIPTIKNSEDIGRTCVSLAIEEFVMISDDAQNICVREGGIGHGVKRIVINEW